MDKPFSYPQFISLVEDILPDISSPIVAFDADGTLWKEDVGFGFFNYQMSKKWIDDKNLKEKIHHLYQNNPQQSCSLIVQSNNNVPLQQYLSWCQEYFNQVPLTIFSFQRKIIQFLHNKGVQIYVVSASPEWVVQEAIRHYALPIDHVIGVKTQIEEGLISDKLEYPLPIAAGKVSAFLNQSKHNYPFFASGNTVSDIDLLELATHFKLVVGSAQKGDKHFDSERVLLSLAKQKSWFYKDLT